MGSETIHFILELVEGLIVLGFSGLYHWLRKQFTRLNEIEKRLDELEKEITK